MALDKLKKEKYTSLFYIAAIIITTIMMILILTVIRPGKVSGNSMNPTLKDKQFIFINSTDKNPKFGDIIVYKTPEGEKVVKRLIAFGKHRIKLQNDRLFIDGNEVEYPFAKYGESHSIFETNEDEFFAVGDNREPGASYDSFGYGPVKKSNLIGVVYGKNLDYKEK